MFLNILLLVLGLALLIGGGHALVQGAAALAQRLGVPPIVIGLTTVAFGTSAPELAVSMFAAWSGSTSLTFGNIVGSNIANVGLLLGITALIRPLAVHSQVVSREVPMMLLASVCAIALGSDAILDGGSDAFQRVDGIVLLLLFCVFLYYTVGDVLKQRRDPLVVEAREVLPETQRLGKAVLLVVIGLVGLVGGGQMLVDASVEIARALAVPEVVIGVTIIAVGTSLPELVTCIIAVRQGMTDLAVGNVVGSNIFNLLFVLGATSSMLPVPVPAGGSVDLLVMGALGAVLLPMTITDQRSITRLEGGVLVVAWVAYAAWQAVR